MDAEKLIKAYVKIRDKRSELKQQDDELKADLVTIETALLELSKQTNTTSLSTSHGVAIRTVDTRYWAQDWNAMYSFIKEHDAMHLMEKRIAQRNMAEFLTANPGLLPEGLNSESKYVITVRRK